LAGGGDDGTAGLSFPAPPGAGDDLLLSGGSGNDGFESSFGLLSVLGSSDMYDLLQVQIRPGQELRRFVPIDDALVDAYFDGV
jgi:hypothetical protein